MSEREDVLRAWRAGEERLYSVAATRPDLYGACLELVRAVAEHLDGVPDIDALITTYRNSSAERDLVPTLDNQPDVCPDQPPEPKWMRNTEARDAYGLSTSQLLGWIHEPGLS